MSYWDEVKSSFTDNAGSLLGAGAAALGAVGAADVAKEGVTEAMKGAEERYNTLQGNLTGSGTFKPYTVSGGAGSTSFDNGALQFDAGQQNITNQLQQQAGMLSGGFGSQGLPTAQGASQGLQDLTGQFQTQAGQQLGQATPTAQGVYDQMRAMQSPDEERQRLALENRMFAQGRMGVATDAYGGTPEQFAMDKAQAEARNSASLQAMQTADSLANSQQARASQLAQLGFSGEQLQSQLASEGLGRDMQTSMFPAQQQAAELANIQGMLGTSYMPAQQLAAQNQQAIQMAQLAQSGQLAEMQAATNLGESNLQRYTELALGRSTPDVQYINALGNIGAGMFGTSATTTP